MKFYINKVSFKVSISLTHLTFGERGAGQGYTFHYASVVHTLDVLSYFSYLFEQIATPCLLTIGPK